MATPLNLVGCRFSRLRPVEMIGTDKHGKAIWRCICDCGNESRVNAGSLVRGLCKSCGCLKTEKLKAWNKTRRWSAGKLRAKKIYDSILERVGSPGHVYYHHYGGRGIKICERWLSFDNFYADMGDPPTGQSIDRIDNDGHYTPANCRWATLRQQGRNRRNNNVIEFCGMTKSVVEWAELVGIPAATIYTRARKGWPAERCLGVAP